MRDPTINLVTTELTNIVFQYLCERNSQEINEAINASSAASDELLKTYVWPKDAREAEDRRLVYYARKRNHKRGRPQKRDRHIQIAGAIALLVENAGLKPLRSHLGRRRGGPSACSIVAAALAQLGEHQSERNVEYIWAQYRQSPRIRHQGSEDYIKNRYHQQFNNLSETMD